ncbi:MAG: outer membrane beta-barrel protein [Steroidobacteraceae bacterium]|nr:outer membrane beta-barrel protein [Steroidobacteraceae bacterium]
MKKVSVIVVAAFGLMLAGYAEAAKPKKRTRNQNRVGAYGGLLVGNAKYSIDAAEEEAGLVDYFQGLGPPTRAITTSVEDTDIGYTAAFGFRFNRYLAAELGLAQYGETSSIARGELDLGPDTGFVPASAKFSFAVGGPLFSVIGILPLGDKFELYGRAGLLFASTELGLALRVDGQNAGTGSAKGDSTEVVYGAGLAWHINQIYSIRLEQQRMTEVGQENRSGTEDVDYTALGFIVRF